MNAIRYGFVLPVVLACTLAWITKNGLWTAVLLGAVGLVVAFVLACSAWGFSRDMDYVRRQKRDQLDAASRDAASRLSPSRDVTPNALAPFPKPDQWTEINSDGSWDYVKRTGPGTVARVTRRNRPGGKHG